MSDRKVWSLFDIARIYAERSGRTMKEVLPFVKDVFHIYAEILFYDIQPGDQIKLRGLWNQELRPNRSRGGSFANHTTGATVTRDRRGWRLHTTIARKFRKHFAKKDFDGD